MNLFKHVRRIKFGAFRLGNVSFLCSDVSPAPSPQHKAKRRRSSYVSIAQKIRDSLQGSKTFVDNYDRMNPSLFRNRSIPPANWYCVSDDTAEILFEAIKPYCSPGKTVIEMHPGLGLMTKKLLSVGPSRLYAFEPDPNFREILSPLASNHPELTVIPKPFLIVWKEAFKEQLFGGERLTTFLPDIQQAAWESDPTVQIFGMDPSRKFIQYMLSCVTFHQGIITFGRPELFLVTTPEILVQITYDRSSPYSALCFKKFSKFLLFSIYFDVELLCEVDDKSFVPWFRKRKTRVKSTYANSLADRLVFIRAVPRKDLHKLVPQNQLKPLWVFISQALFHPNGKIIPYLEKWIPGIGPLCISRGLSVFTEFRDLSPAELLDVFITFSNHPDYESCLFHAAVDSFVFKNESDALGESCVAEHQTPSADHSVPRDGVQDVSADEKAV